MKYNYNYRNAEGKAAPYILELGDRIIINPKPDELAEAGYLPYTPPQPTEEEIAAQARLAEIEELKAKLAATDYRVMKAVEGYDCDTLYPNWKEERAAWRDRINELEAMS